MAKVSSNLNLKDSRHGYPRHCFGTALKFEPRSAQNWYWRYALCGIFFALSYHWTRRLLTVYRKNVDAVIIIESVKWAQPSSMDRFSKAKALARRFTTSLENEKIHVDRWNEKTTEVSIVHRILLRVSSNKVGTSMEWLLRLEKNESWFQNNNSRYDTMSGGRCLEFAAGKLD